MRVCYFDQHEFHQKLRGVDVGMKRCYLGMGGALDGLPCRS